MRRKKRFSTVTHFCKIGVSQATITGFCITWRPGEQLEGRRAMVGQLPNSLPGRGNSLSRLFVTRKKSRELASKFHVERSCVSKQSDQRVWSVHYKQICPWIQPRYRNNAKKRCHMLFPKFCPPSSNVKQWWMMSYASLDQRLQGPCQSPSFFQFGDIEPSLQKWATVITFLPSRSQDRTIQ